MFEKIFEKMFEKAPKEKRSTMVCSTEMLYAWKIDILTKLGPISVYLIFYAPKEANLGFWKIVPTFTL